MGLIVESLILNSLRLFSSQIIMILRKQNNLCNHVKQFIKLKQTQYLFSYSVKTIISIIMVKSSKTNIQRKIVEFFWK